jgi:hypothetical protein
MRIVEVNSDRPLDCIYTYLKPILPDTKTTRLLWQYNHALYCYDQNDTTFSQLEAESMFRVELDSNLTTSAGVQHLTPSKIAMSAYKTA